LTSPRVVQVLSATVDYVQRCMKFYYNMAEVRVPSRRAVAK
jgi:hypothetical protein